MRTRIAVGTRAADARAAARFFAGRGVSRLARGRVSSAKGTATDGLARGRHSSGGAVRVMVRGESRAEVPPMSPHPPDAIVPVPLLRLHGLDAGIIVGYFVVVVAI